MIGTPLSERIRIGIFGERNTGKSSLINALTGQMLAVVSPIKGTTTDPVSKTMELLPLGPVLITDTPGFDDEGELGNERIKQTIRILQKTDIILLVLSAENSKSYFNSNCTEILKLIKETQKPCIIVRNKADLLDETPETVKNEIYVSAKTGYNINELKDLIAKQCHFKDNKKIISDIIPNNSIVLLVIPIDKGAPKGRIILPQQQVLRELLDDNHRVVVCKDSELSDSLRMLNNQPNLVITDSQVFHTVKDILHKDTPLTSFSILFARYKGNIHQNIIGARYLSQISDEDKILIAEGCTHHRQCEDIGTVKLPNLIRKFTGKNPNFHFSTGGDFPKDLSSFSLVIHCGGCMLSETEMKFRCGKIFNNSIPFTNYGIALAYMNGILERSISIFNNIF